MEYIKSRDNAKIKHFVKLVSDKKTRTKEGLFVCEGKNLLNEALENGIFVDTIIISEELDIDLSQINATKIKVPFSLLKHISDTVTPQGIIFSAKFPQIEPKKLDRVIILDGIKDPGNMGTIIRSAVAFSIDAIILLNDCVDHKSPKVIRSTMGGIFKIPIMKLSVEDCFNLIKTPVYATYLADECKLIGEVNLQKSAVIIGNETNGVSDEVLKHATEKIIIPMNNTESLNAGVAASIVMWEMSKCQL